MKRDIMIEKSKDGNNANIDLINEDIEEAISLMYDEYSEYRDSEVIEILENLLLYLKKWSV